MELVIFNSSNSLMPVQNEIKVLWNSVLLGNRIFYMGAFADIAIFNDFYNSIKNERHKVVFTTLMFETMYANMNIDVDKYSESFKKLYEEVNKLRKKKGKNKQQMILMIEGEKKIKEVFSNVDKYFRDFRKNASLEWLSPHFGVCDDRFIQCYSEFGSPMVADPDSYLKDVSDTFFNANKFPISDACVELFQFEEGQKNPNFISFELTDIPDFSYLTEIQYSQFRNSFLESNEDFSKFMFGFKESIKEMKFEGEYIYATKDAIGSMLEDEFKENLRIRLFENLERFTDVAGGTIRNKLFVGFTSVEKLLEIFYKAKMFKDEYYGYLIEYLKREYDLSIQTPFFYVKIGS